MKWFSVVGCSFGALFVCVSLNAAPIENPDNGHWYEYVEGNLSWSDANLAAESSAFMGFPGHLVDILDANENAFVEDFKTTSSNGDLRAWIGLTDEASEGNFAWTTGEPVSYTNWNAGEPNNSGGNENYAEIFASGAWNDVPDVFSANQGYVVEFDVAVPEPASIAIWSLIGLGLAGFGCRRFGRKK